MASLQKIRNHGVFLLVVVGLAMLAFILGDFINSGSSFFNRSREYVGEIAGEDVHYTDFEQAREQLLDVYKIESGSRDVDEQFQQNSSNQVWQSLVLDYTLTAEAKKAGIVVTAEELSNQLIGENPHQWIRQRRFFADENGQFSRANVINFYNQVEQLMADPEQAQGVTMYRNYWLYWENAVRISYLQEKYNSLLQALIGANKLEAEQSKTDGLTSVDIEYVMQPYYAVADSLVKVSNSDIRALYNKQKEQYKQTPNRTLSYISYPIVPSEQDFQHVSQWIEDLKDEFANTNEVAELVNSNSDVLYSGENYSESTVPAMFKEFAFAKDRKAGDVTDIITEGNIYAMARVMEAGYKLPDSVMVRFTDLAQASQLDSLKAEWNKNKLGEGVQDSLWVTENQLPKDIAQEAFKGANKAYYTIPMGEGARVIQVTAKSAATPKVKLAIMQRDVTPSSKTYAAIYNEAKQFIAANNTQETFIEAANEAGKEIHPVYSLKDDATSVDQLKQSRTIVRWAYKAKEGEISDVFECGDQFIVAVLTDVQDEEYRSINSVQAELRNKLLNRKKAQLIAQQVKNVASLEDAATIWKQEVQKADGISLNSYRIGNANEPAVIGKAVATAEGEISDAVEGNNGVYLVKVNKKTVGENDGNVDQQLQQLNMMYSYSVPQQAMMLISDNAEITDNRSNFY